MIWIDVDIAVTVPVNIMPLIDDTDFKTRETGIVYNQAGMDLVWNFITCAGVITQTAVTPTTGGDYDWTHVGDGMYKIEIPASGGASINNDTEGIGYFTGICTGVLSWRSPDIVFRGSATNDKLIESTYEIAIGEITVTTGGTTTSVPTSACSPTGAVADQFVNRLLIFKNDTTTAALRGQACRITASTNAAAPVFTVTELTTAPANTDTAIIV